MTVDLADLVEFLEAQVNPPGSDLFPDASEDDWVIRMRNSFWYLKLAGFFSNYRDNEGLIQPITGDTDLGRDQQQLIILDAAADVVANQMKNTATGFRAKAGPVEYETENSATLLKGVYDDIRRKIRELIGTLGTLGSVTDVYIDSLVARDESLGYQDTYFWRG